MGKNEPFQICNVFSSLCFVQVFLDGSSDYSIFFNMFFAQALSYTVVVRIIDTLGKYDQKGC